MRQAFLCDNYTTIRPTVVCGGNDDGNDVQL